MYAAAHAISLKDPLRTVFEQLGLMIHDKATSSKNNAIWQRKGSVDTR
jgi:hypothetical protein